MTADRIAYSIAEAAAQVGVSEATVRRALANGNLIAHYIGSRKALILADDLRCPCGRSRPRSRRRPRS